MKTYSHLGPIKKNVTIKFVNGYSLELEAGQMVALHVVIEEEKRSDIESRYTFLCEKCAESNQDKGCQIEWLYWDDSLVGECRQCQRGSVKLYRMMKGQKANNNVPS